MLEKLDKLSGKFLDAITSTQTTIIAVAITFLTFIVWCVGYAITHI